MDQEIVLPKHRQIYNSLREAIETGAFVPGRRLPSERKLAEQFGVNITTVRRAFRDLVSAGAVTKRVGDGTYVEPQPAAATENLINFLIPSYEGALHRELEELIVNQKQFEGKLCRLCSGGLNEIIMQLRTYIRLRQQTVLFCDNIVTSKIIRELLQAPRLFVVITNRLDHLGIPSVIGNDYAGIHLLLTHLRELGHRRIGLLYNNAGHPIENTQIAVWKSAFPDSPELEFRADVPPGAHPAGFAGNCVIRHLHDSGATALIALNDELAVGALAAAAELGIRVPKQLSVVSVGDTAIARFSNPPLTAINPNITEHLRQALGLLHNNRKLRTQSELLRIVEPTLTLRHSTMPLQILKRYPSI